MKEIKVQIRRTLKNKNRSELIKIIEKFIIEKKKDMGDNRVLRRKDILIRDNYTCRLCGESFTKNGLNIHHLTPCSLGGNNSKLNLITVCLSCHNFMHCNPKLVLKAKKLHSIKTKIGMKKAVGVGKRGNDKKPRKQRGRNFI